MSKLEYVRATRNDIEGILSVQDDYYLPERLQLDLTRSALEKAGFLVHKVTDDFLAELVGNHQSVVLVCKANTEVLGYALGYTMWEQIRRQPEWPSTIKGISEPDRLLLPERAALYYRQEAVALSARGRGIGRELDRRMAFAGMKLGCNHIIGEILKRPYLNRASYPTSWAHNAEIGEIHERWEDMDLVWAVIRFGFGV